MADVLAPVPAGILHFTDVLEIQSEVAHIVPPSPTVGERCTVPKFVPITVSVSDADDGPFSGSTCDITGVSNVNAPALVPTIAEMVMNSDCLTPLELCAVWTAQRIAVIELQVVVAQTELPAIADPERSDVAKERPWIVTETPVLGETLTASLPDTTGASNVNR